MSEEFLKEIGRLNELNNKLLNDLDLEMANKMEKIRQLCEPSKKDLDTLFSLYKMVLDTYKKNNSLYKLNVLKYTDLSEVSDILESYGYLTPETSNVNTSDENIILNTSTEPEQKIIKDGLSITSSIQDIPVNSKIDVSSEEVEDIFVEQKNPFNSNGPVYAFTNEALNQYMKNYDFEGKSVLASLGSGDFALNSYLLGASEVETFDINQFTYYFYQLKKALIIKYDFEDFCDLIRNPQEIFKNFNGYRQFLDPKSISFFEHILTVYNDDITGL